MFQYNKCFYILFSAGCDSRSLIECLYFFTFKKIKVFLVFINYGVLKESIWWQHHISFISFFFKIPYIVVQNTFLNRVTKSENLFRNIRYHVVMLFFKTSMIVISHTLDDNLETMFFNYFRCNFKNFLFITFKTVSLSFEFLRPFTYFSSYLLLNFLKFFKVYWLEDKSNHSFCYTRNFFRLYILSFFLNKFKLFFLDCLKFFYFSFLRLFNIFLLHFTKVLGVKNDFVFLSINRGYTNMHLYFFLKKFIALYQFKKYFSFLKKNIFIGSLSMCIIFRPFFFYWPLCFFFKINCFKIFYFFSIYNFKIFGFKYFVSYFYYDFFVLKIFEYYKIPFGERIFYPLVYFKGTLVGICGLWYFRQYFLFRVFPILLFCFFDKV